MPGDDELVRAAPPPQAEQIPSDDPAAPAVGKWYWVRDGEEREPWLGCVTHVGSNYAELHGAGANEWTLRVHFEEFWSKCEHVPDPDPIINGEIGRHQEAVRLLMSQVRELTARLAITPGLALPSGNETRALALRTDQPMDEYKAALVKAKKEDLPALFEQIRGHNESLGRWMKAQLIPLKAQAKALEPAIEAIENRIFSVELYAGLVETVTQVREGEPAPLTTKVHLLQRRCYMDEECLAQYQTGGMEFKDIRAFDRWIAKKSNFERLLPFPRCVVAFRVRRNEKDRDWENIRQFLKMIEDRKLDEATFLYIRNGDQLFRLQTEIDFGWQLFPDVDREQLGGKLWAEVRGSRVSLISDGRYQEMLKEEREQDEKARKAPKKDRWKYVSHWKRSSDYEPFSPDSVYYDDIVKHIQEEMARHNRLVLVLQGLLDRSPVLHPHPPWQIWTNDGFKAALELVYDDARALVAGEKPDFEAYRARLNGSIKTGSVTVGQEVAWEVREAEKECARMDRDWRSRNREWRPKRFRPPGDPGPGTLARVHWHQPKIGACTYVWNRERQTRTWDDDAPQEIRCTFTTDSKNVLNVDAYKPGDFHIFFDDPRTRSEYLRWAPLLLEAEEFHAGNRKVPPPPEAPPVRKPTFEGKERYRMRKERKALIGKAVRLKRQITTKGGSVYEKGSLWRVVSGSGRQFDIYGIGKDGKVERDKGGVKRHVRCVESWSFEVDPSVPSDPEKE